jgi:hypothetical protein
MFFLLTFVARVVSLVLTVCSKLRGGCLDEESHVLMIVLVPFRFCLAFPLGRNHNGNKRWIVGNPDI